MFQDLENFIVTEDDKGRIAIEHPVFLDYTPCLDHRLNSHLNDPISNLQDQDFHRALQWFLPVLEYALPVSKWIQTTLIPLENWLDALYTKKAVIQIKHPNGQGPDNGLCVKFHPSLQNALSQLVYDGIETFCWSTKNDLLPRTFAQTWQVIAESDSLVCLQSEFHERLKQALGGCTTLFPVSHLKTVLNFYKEFEPLTRVAAANELYVSCGTPRELVGLDSVIYMYSTPADSEDHTADASGSKSRSIQHGTKPKNQKMNPTETIEETDSDESSSDELDLAKFTRSISTKPTGPAGCNIFLKTRGGSCTLKSPKFRTWKKYIDVKIYDECKDLRKEKDAMKHWKLASMRAKICLGNPLNPDLWKRTKRTLKDLKKIIVENANEMPGVELEHQEK